MQLGEHFEEMQVRHIRTNVSEGISKEIQALQKKQKQVVDLLVEIETSFGALERMKSNPKSRSKTSFVFLVTTRTHGLFGWLFWAFDKVAEKTSEFRASDPNRARFLEAS